MQVLALASFLIVQILDSDLLVNGEHRIAGRAVAGNFDRLIRKRNRGVVSVAGGALDGVDAAAS